MNSMKRQKDMTLKDELCKLVGAQCAPFPSPGDLPNPGLKPGSPALQTDALPSEPLGKPVKNLKLLMNLINFKGYLNSFLFAGVLNHRCLQNLMISVIHSYILNFSTALLKCN